MSTTTIYFMTVPNHPNKEIRKVINEAVSKGWRVIETGKSSHAFCRLYCPEKSRDGCKISVWRTPRNSSNHARQIKNKIEACPH